MSYRWLEHTSELELQIDAATEEEVFELALAALREIVTGGEARELDCGRRDEIARELVVAGGDRAALLAAFLEELVYLLETEDLVPSRVERLRLTGDRLSARVKGCKGRPAHLVKGVTYHRLTFESSGDRFLATVVLDV